MQCPNCRSTDVVKASVAYEMGTSSSSFGSVGVGTANGEIGLDVGRSGGRLTSDFAQRLKPPSTFPAELGCGFFTAAAVFFALAILFDIPAHNLTAAILTLGPGVFAGAWIYRLLKPDQSAAREERIAKYQRLWVCLRCGHADDQNRFAKDN